MSPAEADYLRLVELGGLGKRPYVDMRLRFLPYGVELPSYERLVDFENGIKYPIEPFFNGWKGHLPTMMQVPNSSEISYKTDINTKKKKKA